MLSLVSDNEVDTNAKHKVRARGGNEEPREEHALTNLRALD
ncbi:hypothetical protein HHX47_DHR4000774 [Lentinula edodes]|nr:hypothetical protein HHX47_DHR4000774 [Lentinula edodes]